MALDAFVGPGGARAEGGGEDRLRGQEAGDGLVLGVPADHLEELLPGQFAVTVLVVPPEYSVHLTQARIRQGETMKCGTNSGKSAVVVWKNLP